MKKIIQIRDKESALKTAGLFADYGVECCSFPVLSYRLRECKQELQNALHDQPTAFFFASLRAYHYFCQLYSFTAHDYRRLSILTVGEKAAAQAKADGFQNIRSFPDFRTFVTEKVGSEIIFYPCSDRALPSEIAWAKENGIHLQEFCIYEVLSNFNASLAEFLRCNPSLPVAVFSASQAKELLRYENLSGRIIFCLGQRTANCFSSSHNFLISPKPSLASFVSFVSAQLTGRDGVSNN